ncbi:MAG TPA: hypothetical protein VGQ26_29750 [Streptosporangiaceae bacterium]|nr:hypothetical protein [Streptosporangiaceae bacterium]
MTSGPIEPCPVDAVPGVLAAFAKAPLVALGEAHWLAEQAEFVARLIGHPAFPAVAGDIVVEFGNARYQELADAFAGGEPVDHRALPRVWQHVGGPGQAFTSPIYSEFFHTVRAINASRPPGQQVRVLLGDPPDWYLRSGSPDTWALRNPRDARFAQVTRRHVLDRGRRALLLAGAGHFSRRSESAAEEGNAVQRLEHASPGSTYVVVPHFVFPDVLAARRPDVHALEARLASWQAPALAPVAGTWLARTDALLYFSDAARVINPDGSTTLTPVRYLGADGQVLDKIRLGDMVDALLYLGPQHRLTLIPHLRTRHPRQMRS